MKLEKDSLKCYCSGTASPAGFRIEGIRVRGWKCGKCGEEYLHPDDSIIMSVASIGLDFRNQAAEIKAY